MNGENLTLVDRFWASVQKSTGCWEWSGRCNEHGYGVFIIGGKHFLAHRLSYEINVGEITNGQWVLHRCDNRPCVRPDHIYLGDNLQNIKDMLERGTHRGRHPRVKVLLHHALDIKASGESNTKLAARYGVSRSTILRIKTGDHWTVHEAGGVQ